MVFEKVKAILSEQFDVEEDSITLESSITEDLGVDSLDLFELVMALEEEFEVEIPAEDLETLVTVGDVMNYINTHKE